MMCRNKRRYPDEFIARATAMHSLTRTPELINLYVYKCQLCRGWHLTRTPNGVAHKVTADNPVHVKEAK